MVDPKVFNVITGIGMGLCGISSIANTKLEYDKKKAFDKFMEDTVDIKRNTMDIMNMMSMSPQYQQKKETGITAEQLQETLITAMRAVMPQQPAPASVPPVQQQPQTYGYGYANTQKQHDPNQQLYDYLASQRANADLSAEKMKLERENDELKNKLNDLTMRVAQIQFQQPQYHQPAYNPTYDTRLNALENSINQLANGMSALVQAQQQQSYQQQYQAPPVPQYGPVSDDQLRRVLGQMGGLGTQPL